MSQNTSLLRILSAKDAYFLIVGNIIGIGIFTTTGYISQYVQYSGILIMIWLLGGVLAFCGGVTYAELSTRFPLAGGDVHYLSLAFHPLLGFLFGWSTLFITYTGSIAVIGMGFAYYFLNFFGEQGKECLINLPVIGYHISVLKIVAISIVLIITLLNVRGVRLGAIWQGFFTTLSIGLLIAYICLGISSPVGDWENLLPIFPHRIDFTGISHLGVALIGIYFTYSGWTVLAYIAGEIKNPYRSIPLAIVRGVLTVTILYLIMNLVYLYAMPISQMDGIVDIGHQVLFTLWGDGLSYFFTIIILLAVLSTLNSTILSGARIYYAMSQEKRFFKKLGQLHKRFRTPSKALWLQFGWSVILILSGSFNQLLTYTVFVMVLFGFLSGISLFILRLRHGLLPEIYSSWGYPFTPLVYVLMTAWIMINTIIDQPLESLMGLALILLGLPFYWFFPRKYSES